MKRAILILALVLTGCAAQNAQIRELPADTPAANNAAAAENAASVAAAVANERAEAGSSPTPPVTPADAPSMRTYDPLERLNRFNYRFNARFDEAIFLPVANGYGRLPEALRSGVHHFIGNLGEVNSMLNFALQGRLGFGARSLARFLINSTLGIVGVFDVAEKMHLPPAPTGFGTTLAKWGMHPGPFLVIPFFGPSTLRDGFGLLGDFGTSYAINLGGLYQDPNRSWPLGVTNAIDQRANINFRYYATGSAFEYETIRFLYVRKRLIEDEGLRSNEAPVQRAADKPAGE
jgi:phospholipid-binding lipoprotein MlaA